MNKDQIKNGEVRCFPFYKGTYMGELPFGYSNKKSALKFMKGIPDADVYERFGGRDEYVRTHEYVGVLDKERLLTFNPKRGSGRNGDNLCNRQFEEIYAYDWDKYVFLKDLDPEVVAEMREDLKKIKEYFEYENHELVGEFEKKWGYFPFTDGKGNPMVNWEDFEKMKRKIAREEIEFRDGIIHITVEYLDKK